MYTAGQQASNGLQSCKAHPDGAVEVGPRCRNGLSTLHLHWEVEQEGGMLTYLPHETGPTNTRLAAGELPPPADAAALRLKRLHEHGHLDLQDALLHLRHLVSLHLQLQPAHRPSATGAPAVQLPAHSTGVRGAECN